jgi:hypothetical protein
VTEALQIELIRASAVIIPSLIGLYAAHKASDASRGVQEVKHAMNHLLDVRVDEAKALGTATGTAAGIEQERNRDVH